MVEVGGPHSCVVASLLGTVVLVDLLSCGEIGPDLNRGGWSSFKEGPGHEMGAGPQTDFVTSGSLRCVPTLELHGRGVILDLLSCGGTTASFSGELVWTSAEGQFDIGLFLSGVSIVVLVS